MSKARLTFAFLIMIIVLTPFFSAVPLKLVPRAHATTRAITLYAHISGWNYSQLSGPNPTITVTQGDTISFNLISSDSSYPHLLLIDFDGNGVTNDCSGSQDKCSGNIPPMGTGSIASFTVTAMPGQYNYFCVYHSPGAMVGKLDVMAKPDFTLAANPTAIGPINTRVNGTSTITISPTGGFSGTVTLSTSPSSGLNATIFPTSITGASGTATLTVNSTTVGSYSVTVTGTGSSGTHPITVSVTVAKPDFKITLNPSALTAAPGSTGTVTVTLTSLNGFAGTVSLSSTSSSPGPQITFSPGSVAVSASGSATSVMSVSAVSSGVYSTSVSTGNYNVNVTGTSGSQAHSAILVLTVGSSSASSILPTTVIIVGGIAGVLVVAGVIVYFGRRRPRAKA